jgi:hypothetical protein
MTTRKKFDHGRNRHHRCIITHNVTKNLESRFSFATSQFGLATKCQYITSLSGVRQTRIASYPSRLGDLFRSSIPSFQISEPVFFFLYGVFQTWFGKFRRPRFFPRCFFFPNLRCCCRPFDFLGQEKNRSPTITRKYRNPFLQLAPIRAPEENASSTRLLSSECTAIPAENTSGNESGPTTQYRFMACHSCRGKRRSSSSKLGSEWKPLYFGGPLAPQK